MTISDVLHGIGRDFSVMPYTRPYLPYGRTVQALPRLC